FVGRAHLKHTANERKRLLIGRLRLTFYSLRSEPSFTNPRLRREFAQYIVQDTAVTVVVELVQRIDAAEQRDALQRAVARDDFSDQLLTRLQVADEAPQRDLLVALQSQRLPGGAFLEGQRQHAHAHQVGAMDALEALADDRAHAEQARSLRRPVARGAVAV